MGKKETILEKWYNIFKKYYAVTGRFYKKYKKEYLISSFLIILSSFFLFPVPILTRRLIDIISEKGTAQQIIQVLLVIVAILLFAKLLSYLGNLMFFKLNSKIILLLRRYMVSRILKSKFDLFAKYDTGYLLSRVNEDPGYLNMLFGQQIIGIFQNIIIILVSVVGLLYLSVKLSLFILIVVPLLVWIVLFFSKRMRSIFPVFLEKRAQEISSLQESLNAYMLLKTALREIVGIRRYFSSALKTHRVNVGYGKYHYGNLSISAFITQLVPILIFGIGGYWVLSGKMTLSTLIAFNMFMAYLFSSINGLLNTNITLQVALTALYRIHEIVNYPKECYETPFKGESIRILKLTNVSFGYNERPVLRNVNFYAEYGEKVGIAGISGEGKTTLLKIMAGVLYDFKGTYIVNGKELDLKSIIGLRKKMALVQQEPMLFRGSVEYNLKVLNPLVDDEEMYDIMGKLRLHDFILSLPEGYNTYIDLKSVNLSVGQKQRIAFARAYLKHPDILLLDEITSNLDEESEEALLKVIRGIDNMIVIIVSHRQKPLLLCNRVYLIKDGKSVEVDDVRKLKNFL